jgi:hypothetical protein
MARDPIPTWFFAVVVVRHGNRFLLVQERKHNQLWYLPAGRAEFGESLADAALRETSRNPSQGAADGVLRWSTAHGANTHESVSYSLPSPLMTSLSNMNPTNIHCELSGSRWASLSAMPCGGRR